MLLKGYFDISFNGIEDVLNRSTNESNIIQITKGKLVCNASVYTGDFSRTVMRTASNGLSSYGANEKGITSFIFSVSNVAALLNGNELCNSSIGLLCEREVFSMHTPAHYDNISFNVDNEKLATILTEVDQLNFEKLKNKLSGVVHRHDNCEKIAAKIVSFLTGIKYAEDPLTFSSRYEQSIISDLLALRQDCQEKTTRLNNKSRIVTRALAYMESCDLRTTTINDVVKQANTSLRNLELSFQSMLNVTPKQYLVACRLNAIRQYLLQCDPSKTLKSVVQPYGVVHMGHFTNSYLNHFGEPPLLTLSKSLPAEKRMTQVV